MPRYLHIPHTPDTARKIMTGGRNCLVMSDMTTHPLKSVKGAGKSAEAKCGVSVRLCTPLDSL